MQILVLHKKVLKQQERLIVLRRQWNGSFRINNLLCEVFTARMKLISHNSRHEH